MTPAPMSSSLLSGAVTAGGECQLSASLSIFVATWIAPPERVPVVRDFTFKAVIGEVPW